LQFESGGAIIVVVWNTRTIVSSLNPNTMNLGI